MVERNTTVDLAFQDRKTRDAALILPIIGLLFLIPPFATIFAIDGRIFGIPVMVAYVFTVWALLIAAAAFLAKRIETAIDKDIVSRTATDGDRQDETTP